MLKNSSLRSSLLVLALVAAFQCHSPAQTQKTKSRKRASTQPTLSERLDTVQKALDAQMQQVQALQQQVQQRDGTIQQLQQRVDQLQATQTQNQQFAQEAVQTTQQQVSKVQTDLADVKSATENSVSGIQDTQHRVGDLEHPLTVHYKGISITPGGYLAAESVYRAHNESADIISSFNGIPYGGSANAQLSEFRGSARQSRVALLAEGKLGSAKVTGYYEADFLGAAPTANENQSSSFNLRQRQLFGEVAFNNGWTFTGGQTWSLITTNKKGIEARQEWVPATIDAQYVVGYNFARLYGARITKSIGSTMTWGFAVENPETLFSSLNTPPNLAGFANGPTGANGSALSSTNTTSTDLAPDMITKIAFDPGWGHFEIKALGRVFRDKILPTSTAPSPDTNVTFGGGLGFGAVLPIAPKKADFILEAMGGNGIGRFGDSTNADVTVRPDGSIVPVRTLQALAGFELHPTSKLDWYIYAGNEYLSRAAYLGADGKGYGYGSPLADNSGCTLAVPGTAKCQAVFRDLAEGTTGFWYRFYKGPQGTLQFGAQYEYIHKNTWAGIGGAPKAIDNMVLTSFRYVLP